ncbi:uncharacterized protein LOC112514396 isoform X1 [Cynara cardunculus var. scolymus]|uniref:uncharacterized protein LOC112514396 isoform X1 n=1 Tax=Cynara cardunculus var. scolymus TaxID=59895 RepID=UPI000D628F84|nr:uncharacterized protein LOC112514396 isoform X1 [Cynara cardunculus var. scolymus]
MARVRNWYNQSKTATLIWFISLITFYAVFRMASTFSPPSTADLPVSNAERLRLYDKMTRDLDEHGALFLKKGETSQSMKLSDLFDVHNGSVTPVLKAANPPVRANVLYMNTEYSHPISKAVRDIFSPSLEKVIWFQNSELYHFSMFHASHHILPVPASEEEIEAEANAVKAVVDKLCPMTIVLDRVVLTSTGVLLGCWQVISGTDPVTIRSKLRNALPRAPGKQLYEPAILHTSLARILGHPNNSSEEPSIASELQYFHELVAHLNNRIRGTKATISELWYVEEYDVLALALDGKTKIRRFQFGCLKV